MESISDTNNTSPVVNQQPLVAALYARVSTNRQEEQETIESQIDEIKKKITEDGNVLPSENLFMDDGWTGEMLQRPSLDAMRDAAMEGKFKVLYVYDRGRLSRVFAYQEIIIEELTDRDIQFVTLHDVKAQTPEEKVLQAMQGVFHEYERVKIAERMRRGKLFKAKSGVIINGQPLYGFNAIRKTESTPTRWEINEEHANNILSIFKWVGIDGLSIRGVIRKHHRLGIMPPKGKSDVWSKGTIVRLLRCETYVTGIAYYNKSEAVVSKHTLKNTKYKKVKKNSRRVRPREDWIPFNVPIILQDRQLFDKVQRILDDNQKYARKNRKYDYLLTSKVFCEHGYRRVGDGYSKGNNHYYRSAARIYKFPKESDCDCQGVNAVVLDGLFWQELQKLLTSPDLLKEQGKKWLDSQSSLNQTVFNEIKRLNDQISKVKDEETRYARVYGEGQIDLEQFEELIKGTKKKKILYQNQIKEAKEKADTKVVGEVEFDELCQEAQRVIKSLDTTNKKLTIRDLVDKIIIKKGGMVETWGHIPLQAQDYRKMGYGHEHRDSRTSQCGEVNFI